MSYLIFDGDTNSLSLFDGSGKFVESWPATNRGGPKSDFRITRDEAFVSYIPDGNHKFEPASQHAPQKHKEKPQLDTLNGTYGTLGILRLVDIKLGGQVHQGLGIHAGHQISRDSTVVSRTPLQQLHHQGAYYRTNGCIRTTEAAMHRIAAVIVSDPPKFLNVRHNGKHPMIKVQETDVTQL
jgi:hypothetical protein